MYGGSRGHFLSALKKCSARKGVNNYKEKWKVVASKETSLTVQILFLIYCNPSCKGLISSVKRTPSTLFSYLIFFASSEFNST